MIKLLDFSKDENFNILRLLMNANLTKWKPQLLPLTKNEISLLKTGNLRIKDPENIPVDDNGLFTYGAGYRVVVYIKDQYTNYDNYRYHLTDCGTLNYMRRNGRYKTRYVVTNRDDGQFEINKTYFYQIVEKNILVKLLLCKNCWHYLVKLGYALQLGKTYNDFNLKDYFNKFETRIKDLPYHTKNTAPDNKYKKTQKDLSFIFRKSKNWTCEKCSFNFKSRPYLLEMHHIDGQKWRNTPDNLIALCRACHSEEPNHQHLKNSHKYSECISYKIRYK